MTVEGVVGTESKSAWTVTSAKNSQVKILKPHAHLRIIRRRSIKFQMNQVKDVEGVAETRFLTYKVYASMAVKNSSIKSPESHAHLHIGRKSTQFQMNLMEDVEGAAETRLWMDIV